MNTLLGTMGMAVLTPVGSGPSGKSPDPLLGHICPPQSRAEKNNIEGIISLVSSSNALSTDA